jgi:hypothetical protein
MIRNAAAAFQANVLLPGYCGSYFTAIRLAIRNYPFIGHLAHHHSSRDGHQRRQSSTEDKGPRFTLS